MSETQVNDRPKVMFLSEMCVLDKNSGAAISQLTWLEILQKAGFQCSSVTMSLFDGQEEYPFQKEIAPKIDPTKNVGKRLRFVRDGIEHNIHITASSRGKNMTKETVKGFTKMAAEDIRRIKPDVVIGFGSPNLNPLRRLAKSLGAKCVFYLANASYKEEKKACFAEVEEIFVPSQALGDHYRETLGLESSVQRSAVAQHINPETFSAERKTQERRNGFVTMINPDPLKGGLIFLQLAQMALKTNPELTFLAVESRGTRAMWEDAGLNMRALTNVWWIPKQKDISRVFQRTSVLLAPSIWFEASARVVAEAQLCGIPVLATRVGGIPAQLNGGGYLFDVPEAMRDKATAVPPPASVQPWLEQIRTLMGDDDVYHADVLRALESSQPFHPDVRRRELVETFNRLAGAQVPIPA